MTTLPAPAGWLLTFDGVPCAYADMRALRALQPYLATVTEGTIVWHARPDRDWPAGEYRWQPAPDLGPHVVRMLWPPLHHDRSVR